MKAWIIDKICDLNHENQPLKQVELPKPIPAKGDLLVRISTCGICHTEIDEIEGRTPPPNFPVVPGHQVVGIVEESNETEGRIKIGDRVGVAWIYSACGHCEYCRSGAENLCAAFKATGRDVDGGYAEYMVVPERFAYPIPDIFTDAEAAPLLCAGAIGYRSVALTRMARGKRIGLTGFGASAHLVLKMLLYQYPDAEVCVFARSEKEQEFARQLAAVWAGNTTDTPPELLDCIIDTTPVWKPVIHALECLKPGGRLVINAIRKESIDQEYLLQLDYPKHLWLEKEIKSVANVTSTDVREFIRMAAEMPFKPEVETYAFDRANEAILEIKQRKIRGAKVLVIRN
ncbi:zinc-dependent alcohol dehydrogenase family protein [Mangrovibacterium lignilyticum]|uniref:zinc-dependent alcohol dehydrogenase family protein n=1 Tax=Mangrovibacterium lignilyticum TaxID=2668052 RepID=UPI0013D81446|nr:zinc-dependent alcohol dehydrogenase family protein [Mangrovibacterium lignilyticum]